MKLLGDKEAAKKLLETYVTDAYQKHHALMVASALEEYARVLGEDQELWWLTGYLHDIDYEQFPTEHPGPSLKWFTTWGLPEELIHAVHAHANGFNGFTETPKTTLAKALIACDEICGIFYAYKKLNPVPYGEMKISSIVKRLKEARFAPGINREHIHQACANFEVTSEQHIETLIKAFKNLL